MGPRFHVETIRLGPHGSVARCKAAEIPLDTNLAGRADAFNLTDMPRQRATPVE